MRRIKRSLYYNTTNMLSALDGHAKPEILMTLFRSYCTNFYGCELWNISSVRRAFRELYVAYHSCVKKLVGTCPQIIQESSSLPRSKHPSMPYVNRQQAAFIL